MESVLKRSRYRHTVSVANTAACLAMAHGVSVYKALTAGMLHDCAKCYSDEKLLKKCMEKGIEIRDAEKRLPALLHAKYGAYLAREKYGIKDSEIISAIECHTTGKPGMSMLDKLVFISDYIEPYRNHSEKLLSIRGLAFRDPDKALFCILENTLKYLREKGDPIDDMTERTYCHYRRELAKII